jgi:hypothetical protein
MSNDDDTETLARAIHQDYLRRQDAEGGDTSADPSRAPWETLPESLRQSNRSQAADIERKLTAISCEAVGADGIREPVREFSPKEVEVLAHLEHERWMHERLASGWVFGPVKDVDTKRSPYLVPWDELSEEVRDLDRDTVRQIPQFLAGLGLVVVRR